MDKPKEPTHGHLDRQWWVEDREKERSVSKDNMKQSDTAQYEEESINLLRCEFEDKGEQS